MTAILSKGRSLLNTLKVFKAHEDQWSGIRTPSCGRLYIEQGGTSGFIASGKTLPYLNIRMGILEYGVVALRRKGWAMGISLLGHWWRCCHSMGC
jgi:hypothetical protein